MPRLKPALDGTNSLKTISCMTDSRHHPDRAKPQEPILQGRAVYFERRLFFGGARLFITHVEVTGWTFRGRIKRNVPLTSIREACVDGDRSDRLLYLRLSGRDVYTRLELVRGASLWRVALIDLVPALVAAGHHPDAVARVTRNEAGQNGHAVSDGNGHQALRRVHDRAPAAHASSTVSLPPAASN